MAGGGGAQMTVGYVVRSSDFFRHRVILDLISILLCSVIKCLIGFIVTPTCLTLNDHEMPFYTSTLICNYRRFH